MRDGSGGPGLEGHKGALSRIATSRWTVLVAASAGQFLGALDITVNVALPEITRLRIAVESGGQKKVVIRGQFQCPEGISNLEASRLLRRALGERFAEMVQLTDGNKVEMEIEFLGFAGKLTRKASETVNPEPEPEPEPPPFTGPKYPIDDEGAEDRGTP